MRQLIWLRSDLRLHDNTALSAAMAAGPTLAVYLISPEQWREHDDAACKVDFWLRNLAAGLLGVRVSKKARLTNWEASALSAAQICYAATDAWVSRELYLVMDSLKPMIKKKESQRIRAVKQKLPD